MNHLFYLVAHLGGQATAGALSKITAVEARRPCLRKILKIEVYNI